MLYSCAVRTASIPIHIVAVVACLVASDLAVSAPCRTPAWVTTGAAESALDRACCVAPITISRVAIVATFSRSDDPVSTNFIAHRYTTCEALACPSMLYSRAVRTAAIPINIVAVVACLVASELSVSAACVTSVDCCRRAAVAVVSALDCALGRAPIAVCTVAIITEMREARFCPQCHAVSTHFVSYEPSTP